MMEKITKSSPIGVMDSGVGGISVLAALLHQLPGENFLYCGDTAHVPYGTKPTEEVYSYVRQVVDSFLARGCKAVVLACNTATAVAAAALRADLSIPVIGMEPALKPAHEIRKNGSILVMATPVTLSLPKFASLMERYGEGALRVPCPGLMNLVEAEDWLGAEAYLKKVLSQYDLSQVDAVVLGCTHYIFLRSMLRRLLPDRIAIMDGNLGTARQLERVLRESDMLNPDEAGSCSLETTGDPSKAVPCMERLLVRMRQEYEAENA